MSFCNSFGDMPHIMVYSTFYTTKKAKNNPKFSMQIDLKNS